MRIGLFYSYGPHFLKAVHFLIEKYPNDTIILFLPQHFPTYYFENLPITPVFLPWNGEHLPLLKGLKTFLRIIKTIRSYHVDQFVILFESPRQVVLSKLSGARYLYVYSIHNEAKPISQGIIKSIGRVFINRFKGLCLYLYIFCHVYLCRGRKHKSHYLI